METARKLEHHNGNTAAHSPPFSGLLSHVECLCGNLFPLPHFMCRKHSESVCITCATLNPGEKSLTSHRGVSLKTTNYSCVVSRCLLCRELLPVGHYYQRTCNLKYSDGIFTRAGSLAASRWLNPKQRTETTDPAGLPYVVFRIVVKFPLDVYLSRLPGPTGPAGTTHTRTVTGQTSKARPDLGFPACVSFLLMGALYSKYLGEDRPLVFT